MINKSIFNMFDSILAANTKQKGIKIDSEIVSKYEEVKNVMEAGMYRLWVDMELHKIWNKLFISRNFKNGTQCIVCGCKYPNVEEMKLVKDFYTDTKTFKTGYVCPRCAESNDILKMHHCDFCNSTIIASDKICYTDLGFGSDTIGKKKRNSNLNKIAYEFVPFYIDLKPLVMSEEIYYRDDRELMERFSSHLCTGIITEEGLKDPTIKEFLLKNGITKEQLDFVERNYGKTICYDCALENGIDLSTLKYFTYDKKATLLPSKVFGPNYTKTREEIEEEDARMDMNIYQFIKKYIDEENTIKSDRDIYSKYEHNSLKNRKYFGLPTPIDYVLGRYQGGTDYDNIIYMQMSNSIKIILGLIGQHTFNEDLVTRDIVRESENKFKIAISIENPSDTDVDKGKIEKEINYRFNTSYPCQWTKTDVFYYAAKRYWDPFYPYTNLELIDLGFWCCELRGKVENLSVEVDEENNNNIDILFDLVLSIHNIQEGNPYKCTIDTRIKAIK